MKINMESLFFLIIPGEGHQAQSSLGTGGISFWLLVRLKGDVHMDIHAFPLSSAGCQRHLYTGSGRIISFLSSFLDGCSYLVFCCHKGCVISSLEHSPSICQKPRLMRNTVQDILTNSHRPPNRVANSGDDQL